MIDRALAQPKPEAAGDGSASVADEPLRDLAFEGASDGPGSGIAREATPVRLRSRTRPVERAPFPPLAGARREHPSFAAVAEMSDPVGMLHRSVGVVPDRRAGYRLHDNARALVLASEVHGLTPGERRSHLLVYAAFVESAWNAARGRFRTAMNFDRSWREESAYEDSNGLAIWALGRTAADCPDCDVRTWAIDLYDRALPALAGTIESPCGLAHLVIGAAAMLRQRPQHRASINALEGEADLLAGLLDPARRPDWAWFDAVAGPGAPRLAQALVEAGQALARPAWTDLGLETLRWAAANQRPGRSGQGLGHTNGRAARERYPAAVHATIDALLSAWRATGDARWRDQAEQAWQRLLAPEAAGMVFGDYETGRGKSARAGLADGTSEATLAFQLAHYAMLGFASPTSEAGHPAGVPVTPGRAAMMLS